MPLWPDASSFLGPLLVWLVVSAILVPLTWELVWPAYKRYGKVLFSLAVSATLAWFFGWWSLLFVLGHPLIGLVGHVFWCRKVGLPVWRPDPNAYRASQEAWAARLQDRFG